MMIQRAASVVLALCFFMLAACSSARHAPMPVPQKSDYFTTLGGGFTSTAEQPPQIYYGVNLLLTKPLPDDCYAQVSFQNPADKSQPFIVQGLLSDLQDKGKSDNSQLFIFRSPFVQGIKPHNNYLFILNIYTDSSQSTLITQHYQLLNSANLSQ